MISINWLRLSLFKIDLGIPVDLADAHRIDARCPETFDLDKRRGMAAQKATAPLSMRRAAPGQNIACISAEIFMVAKLEKVSDTA